MARENLHESSSVYDEYSNTIEGGVPDSPPPTCSSLGESPSSSSQVFSSSSFARLLSTAPAKQLKEEYCDEDMMMRPKPYTSYLDEFKKQDFEAKLESWRRAREEAIMDMLRRKEAAIQEWETKQTSKAMEKMNKYEMKLKKKVAKAVEKLERKIRLTKAKSNEKTTKAKQEAREKISQVSRMSIKARATNNLACLINS